MAHKEGLVHRILSKWPGKKYFGTYRFLPIFFLLGAAMEFSMINWNPRGINFYDVYKRNQARKIAEHSYLENKNNSTGFSHLPNVTPTGSQLVTATLPTMPYGISWPRFLSITSASLLSMFAGAQTVHLLYKPLEDFDEKIEMEKERLRQAHQLQHALPTTTTNEKANTAAKDKAS